MLYQLRSTTTYVKTKIGLKNISFKVRSKLRNIFGLEAPAHPSGYRAGDSGKDPIALLNDKLVVVGQLDKVTLHKTGKLHACAHLVVVSADQQYILMQARLPDEASSPNKLTTSAAGHVDYAHNLLGGQMDRETAAITMLKEAYEEGGLRGFRYIYVSNFLYESNHQINRGTGLEYPGNREVDFLFLTTGRPGHVCPNLSEVKWLGWFSLDGIIKLLIENPGLFAKSFKQDLRELQKSGKIAKLSEIILPE